MGYIEAKDRIMREGYQLDREPKEQGDKHDTTKWFRVKGYLGRVGFISSMSSQFCGGCNRLRITADGKLKVCLFGEEGLSLRDSLRSGLSEDELVQHIATSVRGKKKQLGGHASAEEISKEANRPMILIGG
jgi:molybdenum cofactor biosynthesis enzyme MoaA